MLLFRVRLRVAARVRDAVMKSLLHLTGPTRALTGCASSGTYVDVEDENTILYLEEWQTAAALEHRLRSEDLRVLLSVMDMALEPPDVLFDRVSAVGGIEVISAVRNGGTLEP